MKLLLALLFVALSAGTLARDGDGSSQRINLMTVLRLAGARNLDIQLASERLAQARAEHEVVRMQWFPYLVPAFLFRGHDGNIQDIAGAILDARKQSVSVGAAVVMQVEIGELYYKTIIVKRLAQAAGHALDVQRQESVWQAVSAYFELVRARAAVGVATEAVKVAENYAAQVKQAVDAGIAFRGDVFRATTQIERNELTRRQAMEQQRIASARLAQVLRITATVELVPDDNAPAPLTFPEASRSVDALTTQALASRPEMRMSAEQLAAAVSASQGARWAPVMPTLRAEFFYGGLGGGVGDGGTGSFNDTNDYGIGLTWRVGPGGLFDPSRAHLADAKQRGVAVEREKLHDEIVRQVVEAHTRVHSLSDQLGYARKALSAAEQSLKLTGERKAFAVGEVLENIVAEQELTRARLDYLTVVTESNRAQFLLRRAIGAEAPAARGKK